MPMKRPPKRLWFRAKEYGWGWFPITWEGWAVTVGFSLAFPASIITFAGWLASAKGSGGLTSRDLILAIFEFTLWLSFLSYFLLKICYRYGEKPRWRWGKDT